MVRDGYLYGGGFAAAGILTGLLTGVWAWAAIPFLLAAFLLWFFRDPERTAPQGERLILSPADGKVTEVTRVGAGGNERVRISIFLSVFDVHVNRSPSAGIVTDVQYRKGEYLNALNPESAARNEQNSVTVQGEGFEVVFKQIAGLIARRIVFQPKVGDRLARGQRVGMIKFGSRVDVILPGGCALKVAPGQRVKGGASVLAEAPVSAANSRLESVGEKPA